ncbi:MAG: hypothetical protein AAFU55_13770, partial [Pseudomonadota bacterium]
LFLEGVEFTTDQLINYGFDAPAQGSDGYVDNPVGFFNNSYTTLKAVVTPDGAFTAFSDRQNLDGLAGDISPSEVGAIEGSSASPDIFVMNNETGAIQRASVGANGVVLENSFGNAASSTSPAISADGRFVAFVTDGRGTFLDFNTTGDVYVRDLFLDTAPVLVSVNGVVAAGGVGLTSVDPITSVGQVIDISADGRKIAFITSAGIDPDDTNGTNDVYLRDLDAGTTELVSAVYDAANGVDRGVGGGVSTLADAVAMSADGRYVVYTTSESHRTFGTISLDTDGRIDAYLRDTLLDRTILISPSPTSGGANGDVYGVDISADGSKVVFSTAAQIDADDENGTSGFIQDGDDVYLTEVDLAAFGVGNLSAFATVTTTRRVSEAPGGVEADGSSFAPSISPDGNRVGFISDASNLAPPGSPQSGPGQHYFEVDLTTGAV